MRNADVPALANRLVLAATFVMAGARLDASPTIRLKTIPGAGVSGPAEVVDGRLIAPVTPPPSLIETPSFGEAPTTAKPADIRFEPGIAEALEASMPKSAPSLPGHLRSSNREQERRAPAMPQKRSVPEPASILLVVTGLIGLAARRHLLRNRP